MRYFPNKNLPGCYILQFLLSFLHVKSIRWLTCHDFNAADTLQCTRGLESGKKYVQVISYLGSQLVENEQKTFDVREIDFWSLFPLLDLSFTSRNM
jgi:hypothetical protein